MSFGERVGGGLSWLGEGAGLVRGMIRLWEERQEGLNQAGIEGGVEAGKVRRWWMEEKQL